MLVHETEPELLVGLLSLADVDHLLTETAIRTPTVRVARDGAVLPESEFIRSGATVAGRPLSGLVDGRRVLQLFDGGATVVLQALHRFWPPLAHLVAELELELGHPGQANAYLTPPGSQGFAVHEDSHDVFVFQTHGTKMWEIHHEHGERACTHHEACRVDDVLLRPGLAMYLPTGTPHAARAQDTASLHVTLGINQRTWADLVGEAVQPLLDALVRSHLPAGNLERRDELAASLGERLRDVADAVREIDSEAVVAYASDRFLQTRQPRLRGGLLAGLAARELTEDTPLRRRPGVPCVERAEGRRLILLLGDRALEVPDWLGPAIGELRTDRVFTPSQLPLTPRSAVVLCRRLLREGLLEPA